jgi:AraC-like DNA-binding protein
MGSYARLSRWESRSLPEEVWSEQKWPNVLAFVDNLDAASPRDTESVGARGFPPMPAAAGRMPQVGTSASFSWQTGADLSNQGQKALSTDRLLDDLRCAMERNPGAARAAVVQLITFLEPQTAVKPASARGGLAPWQKRKVDRYLRENLDCPVRLNKVAEQLSLSVSYFSRAFKETFGTTPHMHMLRLRLDRAKQLMLTTEDPLSQIALACGLADQAHLSKLFRRVIGDTPSAWRRRNLTEAQVEARSRRSSEACHALGVAGHGAIAASP